jgi:YARHG domain-containing protein
MLRTYRVAARSCFVAALFVVAFVSSTSASAQQTMAKWEAVDFAKNSVQPADFAGVSLENLKLIRGIVFGRHGRIFKDFEIKAYLAEKSWYQPDPDFNNSKLNKTERDNLDIIRDAEARKHTSVEPGDMRFYRARLLTPRKLGQHTGGEWTVLAAEVEAIHGKRFDDIAWLQQYFDERYWYKPADKYDPRQLTDIERKNLNTILAAHKKLRRVALSPGDMELFENKLLSERMLHGLSLHELRLLRNEIYARHGRIFRTGWLQQYFGSQPWYDPTEEFKDEELSGSDKQNVELIVAYETKLHNQIGTRVIPASLLSGLFVEDVRQMRDEIYARHGKVFKEPWTQKYFASFDWYQPDPKFSESSLSEIERRNIAIITAYEKKAVTADSTIEG